MRIACVCSVDDYESVDQPLATGGDIPFGISIIVTLLKKQNHDIDIFVVCRGTDIKKLLGSYIDQQQPKLFCLTAVSSQFHMIEKVARVVKEANPDIYTLLGGHHASLASQNAIECPDLDAICVGEGDQAVIELASHLESNHAAPTGINNLWIKNKESGSIEKCQRNSFNEDLDNLPHIDRTMWWPWIVAPNEEVAILVGRGCPYKCT